MFRYLLATALCGVAFAASAQTVGVSAGAEAGQRTQDEEAQSSERHCLRDTGSRIVAAQNARAKPGDARDKRRCAAAPGRSYSKDDIDRTGETDLGDALRKLDPSIN